MSKFLKCDMHLHSIRDSYSIDEFVSKVKSTDLDIICITDHNVINIDLLNNERLKTKQSNFAGFELNVHISKDIQSSFGLIQGDTGFFHAIVWIEKSNADKANEMLNNLFTNYGEEYDGEKYIPGNCTLRNDIKENYNIRKNLSICIDNFKREFNDIDYYFIAHENKQDSNHNGRSISCYLPNNNEDGEVLSNNNKYKLKLLTHKNVALEGSSSANDYATKGNNVVLEYLREHEKIQSSSFSFSDAENLDAIGSKYNWINFDGTFTGMVLPFTDYESRIIQSRDSDVNPQKNYNNYLECLTFDFDGKPIELNFEPGYNAIIGSRGSGKSLLGKILGGKYEDKGLIINNISRYSNGSHGVENTSLRALYIGQNYFESIFTFDNEFTEIEYIKNIEQKLIADRKLKIHKQTEEFNLILKNLQTLITQYLKVEKNIKVSHLSNNEPNSLLYENLKYEQQSNYLKVISDIKNFSPGNKTLSLFDNEIYVDINNKINEVNELQKQLSEKYIELQNSLSNDVQIFINEIKHEILYNQINKDISDLNRKVDIEATEQKQNKERLYNYFAESGRFLLGYDTFINELSSKLEEIDSVVPTEEFEVSSNKYQENLRGQEENNIIYRIQLKGINEFNLSDIFLRYGVNIEKLPQQLLTGNLNDIDYNKNKLKNIKTIDQLFETLFPKIIKDLTEMVEKRKLEIKLNDRDFKENLSQGERAQAMLDIIFEKEISNNTDYIILDQPEDNLDNKTITEDLIEKIRNNKRRIQMFIVSHSAPVVVNGDADSVSVCIKNEDDSFSYKQGEINSDNIRDDIISILDGGELNLNIRYYKYEVNKETL